LENKNTQLSQPIPACCGTGKTITAKITYITGVSKMFEEGLIG